jgi:serine O-acetyltransferase
VKDVPAFSTVVGVPGRVVKVRPPDDVLDHGNLPDPILDVMERQSARLNILEEKVRKIG